MEILRRIILIVCTLTAVLTLMAPAPVLYLVDQPDFARELQNAPFAWEHKGQTPAQYMKEETKDLVVTVSTRNWEELVHADLAQLSGYIKADDSAVKGLADRLNSSHPMRYIKEEGASTGQFLRIRKLLPDDYSFRQAPYLYRHPYALWSPLLFLSGLLLYIFVPRHRFAEDTLCYGTGFSAVIGPDLVALMMVTGFFTLGLLVGLSGMYGGIFSLFSSNLIIITCVLWAFTLFGLYMFKIAAHYAGSGLQCSHGKIIRYSASGTRNISIQEIDSVQLGSWQTSKWITRFGFLISLLNWRALGPTLLTASRNDPQLEVHLKDGDIWKFTLTGAKNVGKLLKSLQDNGINIGRKLEKIADSCRS